jgi:hypothetical protein
MLPSVLPIRFFKAGKQHFRNQAIVLYNGVSRNLKRLSVCVIFLFLVLCSSCRNSLKQKIISAIRSECNDDRDSCVIRINDFVDFAWDRMYIFGSLKDSDYISRVMTIDYTRHRVPPGFKRLLFVWGKHVVYEEDFRPVSSQGSVIDFQSASDSALKENTVYFTPENAVYWVRKNEIRGSCRGCYSYLLVTAQEFANSK